MAGNCFSSSSIASRKADITGDFFTGVSLTTASVSMASRNADITGDFLTGVFLTTTASVSTASRNPYTTGDFLTYGVELTKDGFTSKNGFLFLTT